MMSGTSADGVDAVCVRIVGRGVRMRATELWRIHRRYPAGLRRRLLDAMAPATVTTEELARLHAEVGEAFARTACQGIEAADSSERPSIIGLAGQTICHLPGATGKTVTLQLGEAARVAERTGLLTVSDFRQSDVAAGGQGAPLVPWTDWVLLRSKSRDRCVQNIGGVGNVTYLPAGGGPEDVIAFDTGPGNMVIDGLVSHITGGRARMDRDGRRAAKGRILEDVLAAWMRHPFLRKHPPKTTGREAFGRPFVDAAMNELRRASEDPDDWIATATAYTARTIARSYERWLPCFSRGKRNKAVSARSPVDVLLCGGGSRNATLCRWIAESLHGAGVRDIASAGIDGRSKECVSFAVLAAACLDRTPGNLPHVTGATRPVVLGRILRP